MAVRLVLTVDLKPENGALTEEEIVAAGDAFVSALLNEVPENVVLLHFKAAQIISARIETDPTP
jgi:hypothetical protein